jgi:uncharacterized membrane protein
MPKRQHLLRRYDHQLTVIASLLFASALCVALVAARAIYTHRLAYQGLLWNLFLAWLPVLSALVAYNLYRRLLSLSTSLVISAGFIWLLFFPNAPYLMTDLMHLQTASDVPFWYDLILFSAFAWTGLFLGVASLAMMQALVRRSAGPVSSWVFVLGALAAGSVGIYLGRFLRWNSWDVFLNPTRILADVLDRLRHPFDHLQTFGFTMLFFLLLMATYWMVVALADFRKKAHDS